MYEGGIAETLNREEGMIGSGADGAVVMAESQVETTTVQKHTMETLMAGEKIIEALELADGEAEAQLKYAEAIEKLPPGERAKIGPPARNPVLVALDLEPETHVLRTIERVHASALYDALLVIPFGKVASLFHYMDVWASRVRVLSCPVAYGC
jgi:U3 small nucleolar RNA-associated protein 12